MNLEDDAPASPPPAVVPPPADIPPAEPPVPATEQELQEAGGDQKTAGLLAALRAEREKSRTLTTRAAKADEYEQTLRTNQPYVDFLRANPNLMAPKQPEAPPPPASADPDAVEAAQLMDFYKADGTLDVERGSKYLALQDRRSARVTDQAVKPFREQTTQERSQQNFNMALQIKDANGQTPTRDALTAVWKTLGPELTADPQVAATMAMLAHGATAMTRKNGPAPPATAPVITEPSGGRTAATPTMSAIEERIAANRGVTPQKWAEHTSGYQAGRPQQLED